MAQNLQGKVAMVMKETSEAMSSRTERDKHAYDEEGVWEVSNKWHMRFPHVFFGPNTKRHDAMFDRVMREQAKGKRVLDIGCGMGALSVQLVENGAAFVLGIDISESLLEQAYPKARDGQIEFRLQSVEENIAEKFDLIAGSSILHHIDYREILPRFYRDNLNAGGLMMFQEPIGGGILVRLFTKLVPRAHTPDEKSFMKEDLRWLMANFPDIEIIPFNYWSFGLGLISSKLSRNPDNWMMRLADRWDVSLSKRAKFLWPYFRRCLIFIRKPSSQSTS